MEKGVSALKPMTMVQVAEVVGVHETTVSRAVSGKYMQTPLGVFEMKYFFTRKTLLINTAMHLSPCPAASARWTNSSRP